MDAAPAAGHSTARISWEANAVEANASAAKTGRASVLGSRVCCSEALESGRPMSSRLKTDRVDDTLDGVCQPSVASAPTPTAGVSAAARDELEEGAGRIGGTGE